jgi:N-formylglutamate amidohydrolase
MVFAEVDARPPFSLVEDEGPIVTTAIHAGHRLRPEVAELSAVDDATRRREEDPYTDRFAVAGTRIVVDRSRFEVDLNRPRDRAVYRRPQDAWGLALWRHPLPDAVVDRSLDLYDSFYAVLGDHLDRLADRGPFVVLDLHSYNHRRGGTPAPASENPEVNVGTGSLDRSRWQPVVDGFVDAMRGRRVAGHHLDVRENVRFEGGHLARWVHESYPDHGCALAVEFKKVYMDELTGRPDDHHIAELARAVEAVAAQLVDRLAEVAA